MTGQETLEAIIQRSPLILPISTSIATAIAAMSRDGVSCVLVVEQQRLVGILTERDIVRALSYQVAVRDLTISDLMTRELITLQVSEIKTVLEISQLFKQHHIRHLPVLNDQNQIVGIITPQSIRDQIKPEYLLRYVRVAEVMVETVIKGLPEHSLLALAQRMMLHKVSCIVVINQQTEMPIGIITERDIVQFHTLGLAFDQVSAQTVMSTPLSTVQSQDSLWAVHQRMRELRVRRLVVTHANGKLAGIVTQTQILKMCDPNEMHHVMQIMQVVIKQQTSELQNLNHQLQVLNAELQQLVTIDELTQIANRRYLNEYLHQEWHRLMRYGRPLSLLLGDIDDFKRYNDTYGHVAGDKCLIKIAQALQESVNYPPDLVARYGGEEFAIVFPEMNAIAAEQIAQKILDKIQQLQIIHAASTNGGYVSISLGIATIIPTSDSSIDLLLQTADQLLYQSKQRGRKTYSLKNLSGAPSVT